MHPGTKRPRNAKSILFTPFLIFSIPALALLLFLMTYTVQKQIDNNLLNYENQMKQYGASFERTIHQYETFASNFETLDLNFQVFLYTKTQIDTHLTAYEIINVLKALQTQEPLYSAFIIYKEEFSYYYPVYQKNYDHKDQQNLKNYLIRCSKDQENFNQWLPFSFSDRTVLLYITGVKGKVFALMIDPSESEFIQNSDNRWKDMVVFFTSEEGDVYTDIPFPVSEIKEKWTSAGTQSVSLGSGRYRLLKYPLSDMQVQLCVMVPKETVWGTLNSLQRFLILSIIALFLLLPLFLRYFYRIFLMPLTSLENTMKQFGNGSLSVRANEDLPVMELQNFSIVFNQMLSDIQGLKVEAYEKQLQVQQAQLQYLQLQIRPHFFLNCLKGIYGMAEKGQFRTIEETILALSGYFRYIFRNLKNWVTLSDELHAVSSYVQLQKLNFSRELELEMDISAETANLQILPWSLLTFIENSIKHAHNLHCLKLQIKSACAAVDGNQYLNICISDNGGGFSEEALSYLNQPGDPGSLYRDYHVGISNIYYRMQLAYDQKAMLLFYNMDKKACIELYIPLESARKGVPDS